jgi:hypothetical protein
VSDLISYTKPRIYAYGDSARELATRLGQLVPTLAEADASLVSVSATTGIGSEGIELWGQARELYVPSIVVVDELVGSETDFDDMIPIIGRLLEPVVNPFLILHDDNGDPKALIDLDTLQIIDYSNGTRAIRESDPEHKVLVFEFRKEYLAALAAGGEDAFEAALLFPAIPYIHHIGLGVEEIKSYIDRLPVRG